MVTALTALLLLIVGGAGLVLSEGAPLWRWAYLLSAVFFFLIFAPALERRLKLTPVMGLLLLCLLVGGGLAQVVAGLELLPVLWIGLTVGTLAGAALGLTNFGDLPLSYSAARVPTLVSAGLWVALVIVALGLASPDWRLLLAHPASLFAGWLIGCGFREVGEINFDNSAELAGDELATLLLEVEQALAVHNMPQARRLIERAAAAEPDSGVVQRMRYSVWKFTPTAKEFHRASSVLFDNLMKDPQRLLDAYRDYLAVTQVRPQLPVEQHLKMAMVFAEHGDPDEAGRIVNLHLQRDAQNEHLPEAMAATMHGYAAVGKASKARQYADNILALYPRSPQADIARAAPSAS